MRRSPNWWFFTLAMLYWFLLSGCKAIEHPEYKGARGDLFIQLPLLGRIAGADVAFEEGTHEALSAVHPPDPGPPLRLRGVGGEEGDDGFL